MQIEPFIPLCDLSDDELVASLRSLVARVRDATAQLIAHLAELDTRDLHLRAGYGSLFIYCRDALRLSEAEAYNRIEAARAARRFPVILDMLAEGSVNLTTVRLLAPHLNPGNHRGVLESARGKRKSEVEQIVARLSPRPDVPPSIRRLPAPSDTAPVRRANAAALAGPALAAPAPTAAHSAGVTSLAPDRYKLQVTIGGETLEKLRLARDLLRHAIPTGDDATILDRALTALLADLAKKKLAATDRPGSARAITPDSRHVPAEVRRAVWLQDRGRCAFVGINGRRCGERGFVEFHHVRPHAVGGEATAENIQLRCRRHNDYEARLYFGHGELVPEQVVMHSEPTHAPAPSRRSNRTATVCRPPSLVPGVAAPP